MVRISLFNLGIWSVQGVFHEDFYDFGAVIDEALDLIDQSFIKQFSKAISNDFLELIVVYPEIFRNVTFQENSQCVC